MSLEKELLVAHQEEIAEESGTMDNLESKGV